MLPLEGVFCVTFALNLNDSQHFISSFGSYHHFLNITSLFLSSAIIEVCMHPYDQIIRL